METITGKTVIHFHKHHQNDRLGLSFAPDDEVAEGDILIRAVLPDGLAYQVCRPHA